MRLPSGGATFRVMVGAWRSLVAHFTGGEGVAGSNPAAPTTFFVPLVTCVNRPPAPAIGQMSRNRRPDARTKDSSANSVIATGEFFRAFFDWCLAALSEYRSNADLDGGAGIPRITRIKVARLPSRIVDKRWVFVSFGRVHHSPLESRRPSSVSLQTSQSGLIGLANHGSAHPCARQLLTVRGLTRRPVLSKSGNLPPG